MMIFVSAGAINWGYALATISLSSLSLPSFARTQSKTFIFGILPVLLLASLTEARYLRNRKPLTDNANESVDQKPVFISPNKSVLLNGFKFLTCEILFVQANQNYVTIHYVRNGKNERLHCRITLKKVESLLTSHRGMVRCHKSFIVNTEKVKESRGNSENLTLILTGSETKIPVSRKYFPKIREQLPLK